MLIKNNNTYILREVLNNFILLPTSENQINNDPILLNELSAFIWSKINDEISVNELICLILHEYEVSYDEAYNDLMMLLKELEEIGSVSLITNETSHLLYNLNTDEYTGDLNKVGDIMDSVSINLYEKTKLKLGLINYESLLKDDNHVCNNLQVIHEEVIGINYSKEKIINKFYMKSNELGGLNPKVTIIDPYLLSPNNQEYEDLLINILNKISPSTLTVITKKDRNDILEKKIKQKFNAKIIGSDNFHDRVWMFNDNSGFLVGTSLNGLGKKYTLIYNLDIDDIKELLIVIQNLK